MQMVRWDPFGLMREFDRLFEAPESAEARPWLPRIDAFDEQGTLVVRVEVPGVSGDDIDVTVEDGKLTISGERTLRSTTEEAGYHRKEIFEGSFRRTMFLPDTADVDAIAATSHDGILEVRIPTKPEALPKKVTVAVEAG
jgi:HSP20 family protein